MYKRQGHDRAGAVARAAAHRERAVRRLEAGLGHGWCVERRLATGSLEQVDGLRAVIRPDLPHLALEDVECLVPGYALPGVLAAVLPCALHGVSYAVRALDEVLHRQAARAQAPLANGVVGIALHPVSYTHLVVPRVPEVMPVRSVRRSHLVECTTAFGVTASPWSMLSLTKLLQGLARRAIRQ